MSIPFGTVSNYGDSPVANGLGNLTHRILAIDDETAILALYHTVLTRSGYRIDTAEDGEVGGKVLRAVRYGPDRYNLLITDNRMPKLSGVELIEQLRSEPMELSIILATATPPENVGQLQLTAILLKPFTVAQLVKTVKDVLPRHMSSITTPQLRSLARRLLAYEAKSSRPHRDENHALAFGVIAKLRGPFWPTIWDHGLSLSPGQCTIGGEHGSSLVAVRYAPRRKRLLGVPGRAW